MRWGLVVGAALVVAVGAVWIVQGLGALHGSFMTGSPLWLWIGVVMVAVGGYLGIRGFGLVGRRSAEHGR